MFKALAMPSRHSMSYLLAGMSILYKTSSLASSVWPLSVAWACSFRSISFSEVCQSTKT